MVVIRFQDPATVVVVAASATPRKYIERTGVTAFVVVVAQRLGQKQREEIRNEGKTLILFS
jgi:hypothetical protein